MRLQLLIAALQCDERAMAEKMNLNSDAILINQCDKNGEDSYEHKGHLIQCYSFAERGVGRNRNRALERADGDICLFSDEDIVYDEGYEAAIIKEFELHPEADLLLFNVRVNPHRKTYENTDFARVTWRNYGRYPAYSIAVRLDKLRKAGVTYSLLFGGGAKYSAGEDSVFLHDCLKAGLKLYRTPVWIGEEIERPSTWFEGYNQKYFVDRGVLYPFLYGRLAALMGLRYLLAHRDLLCQEVSMLQAYKWILEGIKIGKQEARK